MFTLGMPLWQTGSLLEVSGSYEACRRTHIRRETCCRETGCGEPCCVEIREYWPATGATVVLLIWTGARHVVEEIYLFVLKTKFYLVSYDMLRDPVRGGFYLLDGSAPIDIISV